MDNQEHIYQFIRSGNAELAWQLDEGQGYGIRKHLEKVFEPFLDKYTFKQLFVKELLWLNNVALDSVPSEVGLLSQLEELNLYNNKLTTIPKELCNLPQLERLGLSNNKLTSIPKEIGNLTQLRWLYLHNNKLTSIPKEIGNLSQLEDLELRGNPLPQKEVDKVREFLPNCEVYF